MVSYNENDNAKAIDLGVLLNAWKYVPSLIASPIEKWLGVKRLNDADARINRVVGKGCLENYFALANRYLNLRYVLRPGELENIPVKGPTLVISNHPYGMADGLMFGEMLCRRRSDVKLVVNEQLSCFEKMDPWLIKVNVYDTLEGRAKNLKALREMLTWLKKGGCLGIFPAGSASTYSWEAGHVTDDPWSTNIAMLIRKTMATVVPVYFPGRNSIFFQMVSLVNRKVRVALLAREVGKSTRRIQKIFIGKPVSANQLKNFNSDDAIVSHLRLRTYLLSKNYDKKRIAFANKKVVKAFDKALPDIISPIPVESLLREIADIPRDQLLVGRGNWEVYYAAAEQIPLALKEIGRLREVSFRAIGEGSGTSCDLDKYDNYYYHLFLWDNKENKIAGAYRMGLSDKIMAEYGKDGFYNSQFFTFDDESLSKMTPGLEMGRAFIQSEYQRRPLSLGLIWEGIGQFLAKFPRYRYMFGTVSTSGEYTSLSHSLIITFLKAHAMDNELAELIRPRTPPRGNKLQGAENQILPNALMDAQDLSTMVSEIENDGKGIPVLLRQYLKLNGKILAFNVDKSFGNVLDCLILVDIHNSPERSIKRYLGEDACNKILALRQENELSKDK